MINKYIKVLIKEQNNNSTFYIKQSLEDREGKSYREDKEEVSFDVKTTFAVLSP